MNRKNFLRNVVLGIAASLLPKILQPMESEIISEELEDWEITMYTYVAGFDPYTQTHTLNYESPKAAIYKFTKEK